MTEYLEFLALPVVQGVGVSEGTLRLWHHIYGWVERQGYADTADTPNFIRHVQGFRKVGVATIATHLAKMADAGLLQRHMLKRKLPNEVKDDLLFGVTSMFSGPSLPTTFNRYTLPGAQCQLEFKAAQRKAAKVEELWTSVAQAKAHTNLKEERGE